MGGITEKNAREGAIRISEFCGKVRFDLHHVLSAVKKKEGKMNLKEGGAKSPPRIVDVHKTQT